MAELRVMKDIDTDKPFYPLTHEQGIIDDKGEAVIPKIKEELQDVKVGYDGTVYENAGEAVRGQVSELKETLTNRPITLSFTDDDFVLGIMNNDGTISQGNGLIKYRVVTKKFINVKLYSHVKFEVSENYLVNVVTLNGNDVITHLTWFTGEKNIDVRLAEKMLFSFRNLADDSTVQISEIQGNLTLSKANPIIIEELNEKAEELEETCNETIRNIYPIEKLYSWNNGRLKSGTIGEESGIDISTFNYSYIEIPIENYSALFINSMEYASMESGSHALIHIIDNDNILMDKIVQTDYSTTECKYFYEYNGGRIIDVNAIKYLYPKSKKIRVCFDKAQIKPIFIINIAELKLQFELPEDIETKLVKEGRNKLTILNSDKKKLNFAFITDTHIRDSEKKYKCFDNINLFKKIGSGFCDFGVNCGDVADSTNVSKTNIIPCIGKFVEMVADFRAPVYVVRGNHDVCARVISEGTVTDAEFAFLTQGIRGSVVEDENHKNSNYFFADYEEYKIRVIVLNDYLGATTETADYTTNDYQLKWLADNALNFTEKEVPTEWGVIIFHHHFAIPQMVGVNKIYSAFKNAETITSEYGYNTAHFTKQGRIPIIAIINGDAHKDYYSNQYGYNMVTVDQSFVRSENEDSEEMFYGKNMYCVSIFTLDVDNHIFHETRLGRGLDRSYHYGIGAQEENYLVN